MIVRKYEGVGTVSWELLAELLKSKGYHRYLDYVTQSPKSPG